MDIDIKRKKISALALIVSFIFIIFSSQQVVLAATSSQIDDVAAEFICNCGCNKLLPACDMSCGRSLKKKIGEKIDEGLSKQQIVDYMMKNYNEQILAAPTKKGFNLVAWITPFAVLIIGYIAVRTVISKWVRAGKKIETDGEQITLKTDNTKEDDERDKKYHKKMDEELKDFDW